MGAEIAAAPRYTGLVALMSAKPWTYDTAVTLDGVDAAKSGEIGDNETRWGLAGKFTSGAWFATLGYMEFDDGEKDKLLQLWAGGTFGKTTAMLGYGAADIGMADGDPNQWTLGVYHNMGGGFRVYYEGTILDGKDNDVYGAVEGKGGIHLFGMRYDFST